MAKVTPITEQFQHFVSELKESFWGDLQGQVQQSMRQLFELLSERQRDLYMVSPRHSRQKARHDYRNGYYERDFVTRFGTLRLRIARTRKLVFLPQVVEKFQRRPEEVNLLIREAFLRGISTRQVGRLVAILTDEPVSPQTVSRLTRALDEAVRQFHQAPLQDEWAYRKLCEMTIGDLPWTLHLIGTPRRIVLWSKSWSLWQDNLTLCTLLHRGCALSFNICPWITASSAKSSQAR